MRLLAAVFLAVSLNAGAQVRLYTLECGRATSADGGFLSDTGEYDGKPLKVADPCFVVRHPKGVLLWDTGLGDALADAKPAAQGAPGVKGAIGMTVPVKLVDQLKAIGLSPAGVTYVAFSHLHFDHTGNANLFTQSTWILNKAELAWGLAPGAFAVKPETWSAYKSVKTKMIDGDFDVFDDGTVHILKTPGHTPGHQSLLLQLKKTGTVILSGDLYHLRENRTYRRVPTFNVERADTLASMDRVERIVKNTHARLVVQHDERDFAALPKFPAFLD